MVPPMLCRRQSLSGESRLQSALHSIRTSACCLQIADSARAAWQVPGARQLPRVAKLSASPISLILLPSLPWQRPFGRCAVARCGSAAVRREIWSDSSVLLGLSRCGGSQRLKRSKGRAVVARENFGTLLLAVVVEPLNMLEVDRLADFAAERKAQRTLLSRSTRETLSSTCHSGMPLISTTTTTARLRPARTPQLVL
ncbi:hypothetical protein BD289DRAFT_200710 [Coniella lustricola]|uniref:Uncharacterized protein n=1 Tax=Coniella lustricola TaxID=2025994 RepID=A0A2T2ZSI8_9PEZI|nr:hypothetical protein BD289DRAFT_200710 [Coniella lustricola]